MHSDLRIIYQKGGSRDAAGLKEELSHLYLLPPIRTLPLYLGKVVITLTVCPSPVRPCQKKRNATMVAHKGKQRAPPSGPHPPPAAAALRCCRVNKRTNARGPGAAPGRAPRQRRPDERGHTFKTPPRRSKRLGTPAPARALDDRPRAPRPQCYATPTPTRSRGRWPRRTRT